MTGCAIHISDLHRGTLEADALDEALVTLCHELSPMLVLATGDLSNRGRVVELERARALLDRLPSPTLAVPGNHDIPHAFPARFTRPWQVFEDAIGCREPVFHSDALVVAGLSSVRPWRHQGGRLSAESLTHVATTLATARSGALRVVALHHHLAGAPWRASRKFPLKHRDAALAALAAAGAELVVGGHIHQSSIVERHEFDATVPPGRTSLVLATAPGFGRPRPRRTGEAQGLHVYRWSPDEIVAETRIWDGSELRTTARRVLPRSAGGTQRPRT